MPGVAAIANTYNAPNFVGELFALTPTDTPFLSAIGGLTGGKRANGIVHTWSVYDLRPPDPARQRTEGADAPAAETRVRGQDRNVLEIHQETVGVTYTRQATQNMFAATGSAHPNAAALGGTNAVGNEMDWQTRQALVQIARDVKASFIARTFQEPSTNSTVRKTRGILAATVTNVITNAAPAALTEKMVLDLLQKVWENGGIQVSETATLMCGAWQKRKLTDEFVTKKNYREQTRDVGGVAVTTIETDFGKLSVMLNRHMPADVVQVASLDQCARAPRNPRQGIPVLRTPREDRRDRPRPDLRRDRLGIRSRDRPRQNHRTHHQLRRNGHVKFTSTIYPHLVVHDLDITFVDGEVDVTDKATIDSLRGLPADLGVRASGGRPPKEAAANS